VYPYLLVRGLNGDPTEGARATDPTRAVRPQRQRRRWFRLPVPSPDQAGPACAPYAPAVLGFCYPAESAESSTGLGQ
jgi:hypothetical protein